MKSKIAWIAGAILAFTGFLLMYLPAAQVVGRASLPTNVEIYGVSGTLWEGEARQVVVNGLPVNDVSWELHPLALLTGNISVDLKGGNIRSADEVSFAGPVRTGLFSQQLIVMEDFQLYLPVSRVLAQVSLPIPVDASGRFRARIAELEFDGECQRLNGEGSWLNAQVAGTQGPIDFGTYKATLRCEDKDIGITVTEPNKLGLSMDAVVNSTFSRFSVAGKFKPDEDLPREVHQAAGFFGQPQADGYTRFKL